ncbi:MAG TPA: helix-turn-helix transcriptional regulator [Ktedonobacteraceae bacterium]|nr:helix-turn-helix transcriptional regulator [Ktedonobacteraceae bacterium]
MRYIRRDQERLVTLTSMMLQVLFALAESERHGYGIWQDIVARTQGTMRLGPGMLYTSIKRAVDSGLVEICGERPDLALGHEPRLYYRLTNTGRGIAYVELHRLQQCGASQEKKYCVQCATGALPQCILSGA